jgi:monofunctional biosynthetic peptidoglycan transglycosylase
MAGKSRSKKSRKGADTRRQRMMRWTRRMTLRAVSILFLVMVALVLLYALINPPVTPYMLQERSRLGSIDYEWASADEIAPEVFRSVVAAEDANFCQHWGFAMKAIRAALAEGRARGASTISQQVVKNTYLWHGRSWVRKALEAMMTPIVEALWSKRRIVEVYVNIAEFDEGIFGIEAAADHYFGVSPAELNSSQAARLAAVLPSPKTRSASKPSLALQKRAAAIADGAATIRKDGRSACFE